MASTPIIPAASGSLESPARSSQRLRALPRAVSHTRLELSPSESP
ncbi:hypothetical protein CIHG_04977 [Coccidioides immitis H538.4]|uniref:Uncharacterized protein n=2 Tax=Coccidioides immitis TaxID=5501 RepID=A0A0J8RQC0_COCIT|nr:hypothetical protein CIRG_03908 [Coccidioides immitis RMSCC 2394]KMU87037.1 hypothetical protein CIHG_04977 [Coccidioides immitis H538.4]